jgi:hypothetical protein
MRVIVVVVIVVVVRMSALARLAPFAEALP